MTDIAAGRPRAGRASTTAGADRLKSGCGLRTAPWPGTARLAVGGEEQAWDNPEISATVTVEQKQILQERGVLSPDEIHRLASKAKDAPAAKPASHSDVVPDAEDAKRLQEQHIGAEGGG